MYDAAKHKPLLGALSTIMSAHEDNLPSKVRIWPRLPGPESSYDTEGGAQPWHAKLVGFAVNGDLIIEEETRNGPKTRTIGIEFLSPDRGAWLLPLPSATSSEK